MGQVSSSRYPVGVLNQKNRDSSLSEPPTRSDECNALSIRSKSYTDSPPGLKSSLEFSIRSEPYKEFQTLLNTQHISPPRLKSGSAFPRLKSGDGSQLSPSSVFPYSPGESLTSSSDASDGSEASDESQPRLKVSIVNTSPISTSSSGADDESPEIREINYSQISNTCIITSGTRLTTKTGSPIINSFAPNDIVEIWSNKGWIKMCVVILENTPVRRVQLSDGSHLDCCESNYWPIVSKNNSKDFQYKLLNDLQLGDQIIQRHPPELNKLSDTSDQNLAYAAGYEFGKKAIRIGSDHKCKLVEFPMHNCIHLPKKQKQIIEWYSPGTSKAFIDGWAASQQGCLFGCKCIITALQLLFCRIGIMNTIIEKRSIHYSIFVNDHDLWIPHNSSDLRFWARCIQSNLQTVVGIEKIEKNKHIFGLQSYHSQDMIPTTIFVNNTLLIVQ